jgi:hypothetical protein
MTNGDEKPPSVVDNHLLDGLFFYFLVQLVNRISPETFP